MNVELIVVFCVLVLCVVYVVRRVFFKKKSSVCCSDSCSGCHGECGRSEKKE